MWLSRTCEAVDSDITILWRWTNSSKTGYSVEETAAVKYKQMNILIIDQAAYPTLNTNFIKKQWELIYKVWYHTIIYCALRGNCILKHKTPRKRTQNSDR